MARTKASVGSKVAAGKSSKARCCVASAPSSSGSAGTSDRGSKSTAGGGNPVCPRDTPKWQRPITNFFICKDGDSKQLNDGQEAGSSTTNQKPKKNLPESDEDILSENPKNSVLDNSIELEPLNGDSSHKIEEYYEKGNKGKGVGKKSKGKENRRDSKRDRDSDTNDEGSSKILNGNTELEMWPMADSLNPYPIRPKHNRKYHTPLLQTSG